VTERLRTQRELNRALLARQLLLERVRLPIPRALERMGCLQDQYAPSGYIGLWSRLDGFERDELTRALEDRSVVQATLMRETIHLVSRDDFWPLALATRRARREWWLRVHKSARERDVAAAAERLRAFLGERPRTRKEIVELLGRDGFLGVPHWLDLVRVPPSGTWERRRADLYGLAETWVGPPPALSEDAALPLLVQRYLGAFGPARQADIAAWSGVPVSMLRPTFDRLPLRRFRDDGGKELLDVDDAPLPAADAPVPARLLPTWDAMLLTHARRTGILPERYRSRVFNTRTPQSVSTFLVDGAVAGTWRAEDGRIALEPFGRLPREARQQLEEEARALERLIG